MGDNVDGKLAPDRQTPVIILLRESWQSSLAKDAGTFVMLAGLICLGIIVGSTALEWIGALMGMFWLVAQTMRTTDKYKFTIAEARRRLDELELEAA